MHFSRLPGGVLPTVMLCHLWFSRCIPHWHAIVTSSRCRVSNSLAPDLVVVGRGCTASDQASISHLLRVKTGRAGHIGQGIPHANETRYICVWPYKNSLWESWYSEASTCTIQHSIIGYFLWCCSSNDFMTWSNLMLLKHHLMLLKHQILVMSRDTTFTCVEWCGMSLCSMIYTVVGCGTDDVLLARTLTLGLWSWHIVCLHVYFSYNMTR